MNSLENLQHLKKVWATILGDRVPQPPDSTIMMWSASFGAGAVETVIGEIPYRLSRTTVPPTEAIYRIISSQLKSRKGRTAATAVKDGSFESLLKAIAETPLTDQNIARCYVLLVMEEVTNYSTGLSNFSQDMLTNTIYCQQQSLLSNPDLKQVASRTRTIIDNLEVRTGSGEGQALARLRTFESTIRDTMKHQAAREDARGNQ